MWGRVVGMSGGVGHLSKLLSILDRKHLVCSAHSTSSISSVVDTVDIGTQYLLMAGVYGVACVDVIMVVHCI